MGRNNGMRQKTYIMLCTALLLLCFGGCKKKAEDAKPGLGKKMVATAYNQGYASELGTQVVMAAENGYYFYDGINWSDQSGGGFYYVAFTHSGNYRLIYK